MALGRPASSWPDWVGCRYAAIVPTLRRDAADAMDRALKSNRA